MNSLALDFDWFLWRSKQRYVYQQLSEGEKKACIKHEIQAYLINTNNNNSLSPL